MKKKYDSLWRKALKKFKRDTWGKVGFSIVIAYFIVGMLAKFGVIADGWDEITSEFFGTPSWEHWFGTNLNGQDIFKRAIMSINSAFSIGLSVTIGSLIVATFMGALAGFYNGTWVDHVICWLYGCIDSIPFYLFVAAVGYSLKGSPYSMHVAMIATYWTSTARILRGEVMKIKRLEYIEATRAMGVNPFKVIFRHVIPNASHIILVQSTIIFVGSIKSEVILSFLGLGVKDSISWGIMIAESTSEVAAGRFGNFLSASILLSILVMAFNIFADSLQDALDPKKVSNS